MRQHSSTLPPPSHTKPVGFTLIELLVVITIIGILAALAVPAYHSVMDNSRQVQCLSNMRQIGTAMLSWAGDNNNCYPYSNWDSKIQSYLGSASTNNTQALAVLKCPCDPRPLVSGVNFARSYTMSQMDQEAPNSPLNTAGTDTFKGIAFFNSGRNLASVTRPAKTIMLTEWFETMNYQFKIPFSMLQGWTIGSQIPSLGPYGPSYGYGHTYHSSATLGSPSFSGGSMNFLFADGHAACMDPTAVYGVNPNMWQTN